MLSESINNDVLFFIQNNPYTMFLGIIRVFENRILFRTWLGDHSRYQESLGM